MAHPLHNNFRVRKKEFERTSKGVLAYKYIPDRVRSMITLQEFKDSYLEKDNYDEKSPSRNTGWIRPRVKDNEINPKLRYSVKTDNERVKDLLKNASLINEEPLNTEVLYNTPYREVNKNKWISSKPYITWKGQRERHWSETKLLPDSPEPYVEATREIERKRDSSRELAKSAFWASFPKDTWDTHINRTNSIRSYMGIFGAIKSVSPSTTTNLKKLKALKLSQDINKYSVQDSSILTKEDEMALKGRDVANATECLNLIHSPKTAPTIETNLKYTHNKTASNVKINVDELHLLEKINKLKSYYKSAQSLIADQLSKKAHISRAEKNGNNLLFKSMTDNLGINSQLQSAGMNPFSTNQEGFFASKEESVQMFGSFKNKFYETKLSNKTLSQERKDPNKKLPELHTIVEGSTHRTNLTNNRGNMRDANIDIKAILRENLKNKTLQHKNIIEAYFKRTDKHLVRPKEK